MAYQNFYYNKLDGMCHVWDDVDGHASFPYQEYAYQIDPNGEYTTLTGLKVKKVRSWSKEAEKQGMIFEHDVPIPTRVLIDHYFESDEPSKNHRILFFDIEVEKGLKYSTAAEALNTLTSVAYYFQGRYVCLLLDQDGSLQNCTKTITINDREINVAVLTFSHERELLLTFLKHWEKINPTIVSSWNGDVFDCPYIYNRICNVLGKQYASRLSPIKIVYQRPLNKRDVMVTIAGVSQMDYMQLYKKFTYNEESSYSLDAISKKELKRGKYVYEGTLDQLFKENVDGFIEYNVNDVELLVALDKKMDLIEIARGICHVGHVPYEDYQFSSRYLEGALLTYCRMTNEIAFSTDKNPDATMAEGAFVKPPKSGLYKYCYDLDLEAEYPNNIKTLNISPETKWGRILKYDVDSFACRKDIAWTVEKYKKAHIADQLFDISNEQLNFDFDNFSDLKSLLDEHRLSISSAGILYKTDRKGIIPTILTVWGETRAEYRKLAKDFHNNDDHANFVYYDRKQLIQKILLNSLYGVLLLPSFRFYDKENGESVTLSGKSLVQWSAKVGNMYYNKQIQNDVHIDYCIYQDTDSCFFESLPLINHRFPNNNFTDDEFVEKTLEIAKTVEDLINSSYSVYANRYHNVNSHTWRIKQEMVGKRAFWGSAKKRYAMHIINKNGLAVDELEIKGFDVVRSSFPKMFRIKMKESIIDVLNDCPKEELNQKVRTFKKEYKNRPIFDNMLPSSGKEISNYKDAVKGTPLPVKSAQNYNKLLALHKIESMPPIDDGDKIVYAYMQQNPFGFETMALKGQGEDPEPLVEFVEKFIDRERVFQSTFISKLDTIWHDLGWGKVEQQEPHKFF